MRLAGRDAVTIESERERCRADIKRARKRRLSPGRPRSRPAGQWKPLMRPIAPHWRGKPWNPLRPGTVQPSDRG